MNENKRERQRGQERNKQRHRKTRQITVFALKGNETLPIISFDDDRVGGAINTLACKFICMFVCVQECCCLSKTSVHFPIEIIRNIMK